MAGTLDRVVTSVATQLVLAPGAPRVHRFHNPSCENACNATQLGITAI
jgi:hypothetical protein